MTGSGTTGGPAFTLTPLAIQQKEFSVSRLGGYKMRDVDAFLDEVTEAVGAMQAEIDRLRLAAGAPVVGAPDLEDVARQADEIIARAREEAARITAAARIAAPEGSTSERTDAVREFLANERGFLQDLGALVQRHAETVKGMARASRTIAPTVDTAAPSADEGEDGSTEHAGEDADAAATIRLEEQAASSPDEPAPDDGSLRELFWGEDQEARVTPSEG